MTDNVETPLAYSHRVSRGMYGLSIALHPRTQGLLISALLLFCVLYGAACALFIPYFMLPLVAPVVLLVLVVIWALPDSRTAPVKTLDGLFFVFLVGLVLWPNYLAFTAPGLPWVTATRLTGVPLVVVLLVCVSTSRAFRCRLGDVMKNAEAVWRLLVAFVAIQFVSVLFSAEKGDSLNKLVNAQIAWTAMFFVSCSVLSQPRMAERWAAAMWLMTFPLGAITIVESKLRHLPWVGHIPSFLAVNDDTVARILAGAVRTGTTEYRAQATFSLSLSLAEYLAMAAPFAIHFLVRPYRPYIRILAGFSLPVIAFTIYLSHSRLGFIGLLITVLFYPMIWAVRRWQRAPRDVIPRLIVFSYPVIFVVGAAATFLIGHIRHKMWGSGEEAVSNQARVDQYNLAWPKIFSHPWGYGIGQGADVLGYHQPGGLLTIDTYYIRATLDYGVLGFAVYYGMILAGIIYGIRGFLQAREDNEELLLIPAAIVLVSFIVITSVFSQEDNHSIIFMILGMIGGLLYRARQAAGPDGRNCVAAQAA